MSELSVDVDHSHYADELLKLAALKLRGSARRQFLSEVCDRLCDGNARQAENRFGWGRATIEKGSTERAAHESGESTSAISAHRGKKCSEEANPQLAIDIRLIVEPNTHCDPELKSDRVYTNMTSREVHEALRARGYRDADLPSERTLRDILNRMNYRLKRIRKAKPLKKTEDTDAIFENVKAVRTASKDAPQTLEISVDTKTKVKLGEFSLGGKNTHCLRQ